MRIRTIRQFAVLPAVAFIAVVSMGLRAEAAVAGLETRSTGDTEMTPQQGNDASNRRLGLVLDDAVLYGLDVQSGSHVATCFRRIKKAIEAGEEIDGSDVRDLGEAVDRAKKKVALPLEYRLAFQSAPPPEIISVGDFFPYTLPDGTPVGKYFTELPEHERWWGMSGASKSSGAVRDLDCAMAAGKSVFTIDSKGEGFFDWLIRKYPGRVLKACVGKHAFFNPWKYYHQIREYFLTDYSRKDSRLVSDAAYEQSKRQNATSGAVAVTHGQMMANMVSLVAPPGFPRIPQDFVRSMFSVFYDIQQSALFNTCRTQSGWSLRDIVRQGRSVIVDTSPIAGTTHEQFLVCALTAAIRHEVRSDPVLSSQTGTTAIIYIDECTQMAAVRVGSGLPSLVHLATLLRSSGVVLICVYASPAGVHPILHSAQFVHVCQISNGDDLRACQRMLSLSERQTKALSTLPKGVAVLRMASRFNDPFLIVYPKPPPSPKMTDAEVAANNSTILANLPPVVPEDYRVTATITPPVSAPAVSAPSSKNSTDKLVIDLLGFLHKNLSRGIGVARGADEFKYRGRRFTIVEYEHELQKLAADKLCVCIEYRRTNKGSATHLYLPSEEGYALLNYPPDMCIATAGAGVKEAVFLRVLPEHFRRVHNTVLIPHMRRNGKTPDAGFEHGGNLIIAMELSFETDAKHEAENAAGNVAALFDVSVSVFMTKQARLSAEAVFAAELDTATQARVRIIESWQLFSCTDLSHLYACPGLSVTLPPQAKGSTP